MAGGEFRLGTDSIYMADDGHIRPKGTSLKSWITWLRFERKTPGSESFQLLMRIARRKLGLADLSAGDAGLEHLAVACRIVTTASALDFLPAVLTAGRKSNAQL